MGREARTDDQSVRDGCRVGPGTGMAMGVCSGSSRLLDVRLLSGRGEGEAGRGEAKTRAGWCQGREPTMASPGYTEFRRMRGVWGQRRKKTVADWSLRYRPWQDSQAPSSGRLEHHSD